MLVQAAPPGPDEETASEDYARRFRGRAGDYLLDTQERCITGLMPAGTAMTVLDVGGGHGQTAAVMTKLGHRVTVLGSTEASLARLRQGPLSAQYTLITGNLLSLPFADASFDLVISVRLLSHMRQWHSLVDELCRVARRSVIVDYPRRSGFNALTPLLFGLKRRVERNTRTYTSFRDAEIDRAFRANGFERTARAGQFCLPMVVHRMTDASPLCRSLEHVSARLGLGALVGSPVLVRADRAGVTTRRAAGINQWGVAA